MISSKPRLVVPYGLKTLLEGVSRAILKTNPSNITQFAAIYFKELIVFREGNTSLDIRDLVKQFHQIKVEKWSEGMALDEKPECVKQPEVTSISQEPTRMEKSTDTEEDNIAGQQFSNKTTQFPAVHAETPQPEETTEGVWCPPSKPTTPKTTTPSSSPPPAPVSAEYAYVPADPAQFAAQMLALATSEAGQPPPYSNMWTLYCLTDMNQQSRPSPPPASGPFPQATLYLSNPKDPQFLQSPPKVTSPTYVMMDDNKKASAPPFILVGSNVQESQDWKPIPGHAVVSQSDALKRYAAVQVPIAVPADQKFQKHTLNSQNVSPPTSGQDGPRPQSPVFLSVAFPVEDVAKKSSGSGDKRTPFGSYGIAGEITVTTAHVHRAET
ncbi:calcium-binding tyrosine phosphorylation-regulated protein isoform X1 [Perognathus longimembris pacificus]|uniref:calcium-binding tyrosine phosphorylation-regulated protein isoform X1 n=2 Tax=Perognathus longimembris pacificus TaxID=214514 RepID=UPI002018762D|nr:calcium-binding tyrosine phosphorylation-regulated protein isoform X1 [Perognathus longimembris pacificus]XP_048219272.1 calcium-binding tyrosine phosphorylation-regulated protein isoform X1 [Perognathus longimembris pacificus]XP_048219274.1 calcium-binding tyrosine phosphorylation-regulated protein isoform X1 [Perognathus longimembris pacificus]XP_048219275.1 calcium-binding tyrosine phosphorylation-regulated protein isoform X1 [Perognathus longimembris pacificus]